MAALRTVSLFVLAFALLGIVLGTMLAPTVLAAELCGFTTDATTSRPCVQTVRDATSGLLRYQAYSALGGAVLGTIVGLTFVLRGKKKPVGATPTTPTPPPA